MSLICADALHIPLADESVQCCVTSPPYWGLRDYGTAQWTGGDPECDHRKYFKPRELRPNPTGSGIGKGGAYFEAQANAVYKNICAKCGAERIDQQLGLEETPEEYVENMVQVFREVRRVLRRDGVLWLNLGSSYAGSGQGWSKGKIYAGDKQATNKGSILRTRIDDYGYSRPVNYISSRQDNGFKPKDLVPIPWLVALALQRDGWWLRSDIIWAKPNPMPESVTDRPTQSHEYIFLLTKNARYYYDVDAIREPHKLASLERYEYGLHASTDNTGLNKATGKGFNTERMGNTQNYLGRNKRSVWTVATQSFSGAHYACFPEKLVEPCILAGSNISDIVLDPFVGSGTTVRVAMKHNRIGIGMDLKFEYLDKLARKRTNNVQRRLMERIP